MTYHVYANACTFGIIEAESAQQARDIAANMAGYIDEADMEERIGSDSELIAERV